MNSSPIGIFDSGIGGLSVWKAVKRALPDESIIYLGDGARCPYGDRSREEILGFTREAAVRLMSEGAKLIIVACNTATAMAIDPLRHEFPDFPFVGLEPAVKPAAEKTESGTIAVIATSRAFDGELYRKTSAQCRSMASVIEAVGEKWVEMVEQDKEDTDEALDHVRKVVEPLVEKGADYLVLGCTHYPFLRSRIEEVIGSRNVRLIDSSEAVARRTEYLLDRYGLKAPRNASPKYSFITYADEAYIEHLKRKAYGKK